MWMINNSKTYILATIGGVTLFGSSFAIGAHSNRVEPPVVGVASPLENLTSNFAYPKIDEIDTIEHQVVTTKPKHKNRKRIRSTPEISAVPLHERIKPSSKVRVRIAQPEPSVSIPVPPPSKTPVDEDNDYTTTPAAIIDNMTTNSSDNSQSTQKQHSKAEAEAKEIRGKIQQIEQEDRGVTKGSPEKSGKEPTPEHPQVESKEVKPEPSTPTKPSD